MNVNLRKSPRQIAFKIGAIQINACSVDIECLIWNISECGAQIEPLSLEPVPNEFELFVDENEPRRSCFVIWREGPKIGVAFTV
ncbi:pilus assembly protein PilZ [Methylobacterium iners]|uniref:PilZ domain-containing protein n=1 Tax=Methylobacterium iners TaxID=418707 RepID=A0ABQ4S2Q7_9HYPH|nr:pilus assembly protein PilZ [Methylobacterium iners]GJD96910.1 hypothetical protein OCOJLMKI_4137 [Methylobacterium iners]